MDNAFLEIKGSLKVPSENRKEVIMSQVAGSAGLIGDGWVPVMSQT